MNSSEIYKLIEEIASTSSKNEKQALIAAHKDDEDFKRVLDATFNPFKTYGIRKRPAPCTYPPGHTLHRSGEDFSDRTWKLLEQLQTRYLTGNGAIDGLALELGWLNPESSELLWRIVSKDLRADFGESSVNKAIKGLIPDFPYMRCSLPKDTKLDEWDWDDGAISQEKADGMFANVDHDASGVVSITTRQGTPFPMEHFARIEEEVQKFIVKDTQCHGEFLVLVDGVVAERQIGNGIMNRVLKGGEFADNEVPVLKLWDQIPLSSVVTKGKCETPYEKRLVGLFVQLPKTTPGRHINVIDTKIVHSLKEAYAHYKELLLQGKEGTIIKKKTAIWRDGTSKEQIKLKLEAECELEVFGFEPGNGKNADTFGSLMCRSKCGELIVNVSGFTDAKRKEIHESREKWLGQVITVRSNSILKPSESNPMHSLFLPRFVEERLDKSEADDLARIGAQFEAAMAAV